MTVYFRAMPLPVRRTIAATLVFMSLTSARPQSPALVGYWHNWNDFSAPYIELDQVDPRYNVIEVAFAEPAPGTTYDMQFAPSLTAPATFIAQVAAHQALGRNVLISIGGANATVQLNSDAERDQFVASMMAIITTYGFDGIDIDLEGSSVSTTGGTIAAPIDAPLTRLIDAITTIMADYRAQFNAKLFLTMAPETAFVQGGQGAFGGIWGAYLPIIDALRDSLDILQVQLYNSGSMYGIDGGIYTQGTADFIISQTEAVIQGFSTGGGSFAGLQPEHVAVALPACASAAGGGHTDTATVRAAMEYLLGEGPQPGSYALVQPGGYPDLRGMMTWSINWDAVSACDGSYSYAENFERIFDDFSTVVPTIGSTTMAVGPNPFVEMLTITLPASNGGFVLRWLDATGRAVRIDRVQALGTIDMETSSLRSGVYVLELSGISGQLWRARVIKE